MKKIFLSLALLFSTGVFAGDKATDSKTGDNKTTGSFGTKAVDFGVDHTPALLKAGFSGLVVNDNDSLVRRAVTRGLVHAAVEVFNDDSNADSYVKSKFLIAAADGAVTEVALQALSPLTSQLTGLVGNSAAKTAVNVAVATLVNGGLHYGLDWLDGKHSQSTSSSQS